MGFKSFGFSGSSNSSTSSVSTGGVVVAFTVSIPFNKPLSVIKNYGISSDITLVPNEQTAVEGCGCTMTVTMDGIHQLLFDSKFRISASSDRINNVLGGVHLITFYFDGQYYIYSIQRLGIGDLPQNVAPSIISAVINENAPDTILLTANKPIDTNFIANTSQFTIAGKTVINVSVSGSVISVKVNARYYINNVIAISYSQNGIPLRDLFGTYLLPFANLDVTNNITSNLLGYVELQSLDSNIYKSEGGYRRTRGINAIATASSTNLFRALGVFNAGNILIFKNRTNMGGSSNQKHIFITNVANFTAGGTTDSANIKYGLCIIGTNLWEFVGGSGLSQIAGQTVDDNTQLKFAYENTTPKSIKFYKSSDGITWTLVKAAIAVPSGSYYIGAAISEGNIIEEFKSDCETGVYTLGRKMLLYLEPKLMDTTYSQWNVQNVNAIVENVVHNGVKKLHLASGTNQSRIGYARNAVYTPNTGILRFTLTNVTIVTGKLFVRVASLGQIGISQQLVNGNSTFDIDLSGIADSSYIWIVTDTPANGGGDGYIEKFEMEVL